MKPTVIALALALMVAVVMGPAAHAAPDGIEVRFGDDVDGTTRWYVDAAIERSWTTLAPHLPAAARDMEALIVVVTNADEAVTAWAEERGISESRARRQFTARSSSYAGLATAGLTVIINDNYPDAGTTIHEFTHLFQHHLAGEAVGARWISEGAAEYFRLLVEDGWRLEAAARSPKTMNRAIADEWALNVASCGNGALPVSGETCRWATESLRELERGGPFDVGGGSVSAYARASVAFQHLIDRGGVDGYVCYLDALGDGAGWRNAFEGCYGWSVDEFYESFDELRDAGFVAVPRPRRNQFL